MISSRSRRGSRRHAVGIGFLLAVAMLTQGACGAPVFTETDIPLTAKSGQNIPVRVRIDSEADVDRVEIYYRNPADQQGNRYSMELEEATGYWTHEIPAQPWKGVVEWQITAHDASGNSTHYPASGYGEIEIQGKSPPKPFPWNMVFMVAFLGVVLVLTELAYKPGVYRKTGRERARELEEEDRLREMEERDEER